MATIAPFHGFRYNTKKVKNVAQVVTPPYDVISPIQQKQFYQSHQYNFIRILLGKEKKGDGRLLNKYSRAGKLLRQWIGSEIVTPEQEPAIYVYEQAYTLEGKRLKRIGFIALLKLEEMGKGVVFPHEKTFCKPKEDRFSLLEATQANLSPLFGLYVDTNAAIKRLLETKAKEKPLYNFKFEGIENRLWKISDQKALGCLLRLMSDKQIFIADGHHRYEVAWVYHKLMKKDKGLKSGYVMMYFCNLKSPGLKVLPTHRVIRNLSGDTISNLISFLEPYFTLSAYSSARELFGHLKQRAKKRAFGLYKGGKEFYLLDFKTPQIKEAAPSLVESKKAYCYNNLDVVLLHNLVIRKILGIKDENFHDTHIFYTRDEMQAIQLVKEKKYQVALFMNAPSPEEISAIASCFQKMPHKSTYFYPKPVSGLVMNSLKNAII